MAYKYSADITNAFFIVFVVGTFLKSTFWCFLEWMNSRKGDIEKSISKLHSIHPIMEKVFSRDKIEKALAYNGECFLFEDMADSVSSGISFMLLLFGAVPFLFSAIDSCFATTDHTVACVLTSAIAVVAVAVMDIPSSAYETFSIESKYGFNTTSVKTFVSDTIISSVINMAISSSVIAVANKVLVRFGPFGTLDVLPFFVAIVIFGSIMEFLYMTVFIRIFNDLTPLEDNELRSRISDLAKSFGYGKCGIYVMDASRRSNKGNAFIGGIWKSKKIVLFDTLLDGYSDDEIVAILGHELAHGKLHHLTYGRIASYAFAFAETAIAFGMAYDPSLYHAFGFSFVDESNVLEYSIVGLSLALMVIRSCSWIFEPVFAAIDRHFEYAADSVSARMTGCGTALVTALAKLSSDNMSDPFPNAAYEAFAYDHPSLRRRVSAILEAKTEGK